MRPCGRCSAASHRRVSSPSSTSSSRCSSCAYTVASRSGSCRSPRTSSRTTRRDVSTAASPTVRSSQRGRTARARASSGAPSGSGAAGEVTALLCRMSLTAHHYDGHRPRRLNDEQAQAYARRQQGRARSGAATPRAPIAAAAAAENGSGQGEQCSICLDAPRDTLTVPCGHVASCEACLKRLLELQGPHRALCVVCRKPIERLVRAPPAASTREQHE
mmetsp:Transcript_10578/g.31259  ORF Transcript_10578/g.31259 Transcript_10578/m.31259 type:complete len:218 (-) Transcript_10578:61-714(-)